MGWRSCLNLNRHSIVGLIGCAITLWGLSFNAQADELLFEARQQTKNFGKELKATLIHGINQQGVEAAIGICRVEAPVVADRHSDGEWLVRRTSLKVRSLANSPDEWERTVLQDFEQRLAEGNSVQSLEATLKKDGQFRYMKAIPTGGVCLSCHGSSLAEGVVQTVDNLYPQDQAKGFSLGDIRGAFSLSKTIE